MNELDASALTLAGGHIAGFYALVGAFCSFRMSGKSTSTL